VTVVEQIAFATSSALPVGSPDDQLAADELLRRGHPTSFAVWDDAAVDWSTFDTVVLRSTWDYFRRRVEFLEWLARCARVTDLWNPEPMAVWNSHKAYLFDLAARGVSIIPTERGIPGEPLEALCRRRAWGKVVVKPMVSAAATGAYFVPKEERAAFEPTYASALRTAEQIVQPFVEGVLSPGERSLVYFDGIFSHAFSKGPALPTDRRELDGLHPVDPTPEERSLAERALLAVGSTPLYARVDVVSTGLGEPMLMELELVEPYLGFVGSNAGLARFADALEARRR
jgi:hypothetical protein